MNRADDIRHAIRKKQDAHGRLHQGAQTRIAEKYGVSRQAVHQLVNQVRAEGATAHREP